MNFLVIDGNSILNRAFYGIKVLTTKDGRFTNAIYGFMNIFLRLKDECRPQAVAVAFDVKQPTFRHEMYGGYKATRKGMPDELAQQMPVLKELLEAMGVPIVEKPGYEADDILGSLAATLLFTVSVINNFLKIIKACSLQGLQAIYNLYNGSLVIAYARSPGKVIFVNMERTTCSFTLFKYCINMGNKQNRVFACSL